MFRKLNDQVSVSPQITIEDVGLAAGQGFSAIINNRPDNEDPGQPNGDVIASEARKHGLDYIAIPIDHSGFPEDKIAAMAEVLKSANRPVLAYCRSGTRSTLLWALAQARSGIDVAELALTAEQAGYSLQPIMPLLRQS